MELTDAELLQRSRTEDTDAFAQLVDRHKHLVINYLTRLTGCRDRAEDFAQETFVRFFEQLHQYREEGVLTAYLLRIATNLVRSDERRKRRWSLLRPILVHSHSLVGNSVASNGIAQGLNNGSATVSPQGEALAREEQEQVSEAIASIDLLFRAPLVLREIEGCSYQEIATALQCSEGTVKSRLHRGRQLLKEKLAPYWNGGHG